MGFRAIGQGICVNDVENRASSGLAMLINGTRVGIPARDRVPTILGWTALREDLRTQNSLSQPLEVAKGIGDFAFHSSAVLGPLSPVRDCIRPSGRSVTCFLALLSAFSGAAHGILSGSNNRANWGLQAGTTSWSPASSCVPADRAGVDKQRTRQRPCVPSASREAGDCLLLLAGPTPTRCRPHGRRHAQKRCTQCVPSHR
jgi:hypothetical protein